MTAPFHAGQKVVCVDEDYAKFEASPRLSRIARDEFGVYVWPKHLSIYTIRGIFHRNARYFLRLDKVFNPQLDHEDFFGEQGFWSASFRPLVARKTDISVFTAMLTEHKQPVTA